MADHAEQKQLQHQWADCASDKFYGVHGVHAHRGGEYGDGAEDEREARGQGRAQVGGPEGGCDGYVSWQVACQCDLPQCRQRQGRQPAGDVEAARVRKSVVCTWVKM